MWLNSSYVVNMHICNYKFDLIGSLQKPQVFGFCQLCVVQRWLTPLNPDPRIFLVAVYSQVLRKSYLIHSDIIGSSLGHYLALLIKAARPFSKCKSKPK